MSIFSYKKPLKTAEEAKEPEKKSIFAQAKESNMAQEQAAPQKKGFTQAVSEEFGEQEDLQRNIERNIAQQTSRQIETVAGLPGNIIDLSTSLFGIENNPRLPTSQDIRKFSEKATGGYTAPQNETEEKAGDFQSNVASLALPGSTSYSMLRNIGIPIAAAVGKEGVKRLGGKEKAQAGTEAGLMFVLDLIAQNGKGVQNFIGNLFKTAESHIPTGTLTNVKGLEHSLTQLEKNLSLGGSAQSKEPALKKISELQGKIKNGQLDPKELPAFRVAINEAIDNLGGFIQGQSPSSKRKAVKYLGDVKSAVIEAAEKYGQVNPQFLENWQKANEAASVFHQSKHLSNFIKKKFGRSFKSQGAKLALGAAATHGGTAFFSPATALVSGGIGTGLAAGYKSIQLIERIAKSPTLRKYYTEILKGAARNNAAQVISNTKKLDAKMADEEKKEAALIEKYTK